LVLDLIEVEVALQTPELYRLGFYPTIDMQLVKLR